MKRDRVISFIDGFNLYHAIANLKRPHLKWLDLLTKSFDPIAKKEIERFLCRLKVWIFIMDVGLYLSIGFFKGHCHKAKEDSEVQFFLPVTEIARSGG